MTEDKKREKKPKRTQEPRQPAPDPVRLVPSARFYSESLAIPPGIPSRDLQGFLEGEVEELSMFPIESTSWGYMENRRKTSASTVLLYAAFREQVNGATDPAFARRHAVLPGFAVMAGRISRKTTWITLVEPECVTLVRMPERSAIPNYVDSLYGTRLDENPEQGWALREQLIENAPIAEGGRVEEGLIRSGKPTIDRRGAVVFPLERQRQPHAPWKRCGIGKLVAEATLLAADVRDTHFLVEERGRRRAVRQLRTFLRLTVLAFIALGIFQYRYTKLRRETEELAAQVAAQRSAVEALQEQELLAKSATKLSEPPIEIFTWMTAANDVRPDSVWFLTAYADREGYLGFSGEAPNVATVNQYRDALEKAGRFDKVEVKELNTAKRGVKFTILVSMKAEPEVKKAEGTS